MRGAGTGQLSLRQRALAALARREHSRSELARKLAPYASDPGELAGLLDELERGKLLSARRFAESLVHRRQERYGNQRIALELKEHHLDPELVSGQLQLLAGSEIERCRAVWAKKFTGPAANFPERAKQARFLSQRGFSPRAIAAVLGDSEAD
jgi:regulatory protein